MVSFDETRDLSTNLSNNDSWRDDAGLPPNSENCDGNDHNIANQILDETQKKL